MSGVWAAARILVFGGLIGLLGCAAQRPWTGVRPTAPCPDVAGNEMERVCLEDRAIETLQARFRATVVVDGEVRSADGILLVRRPDAVRVKLFGLAGMTVHDAVWVGDTDSVRGFIRRPLSGPPITVELKPGDDLDQPEAELSLALWSLWRPRCATVPTAVAAGPGWLRLDPYSAHATARDVRVGPLGVDEERLVRAAGENPDMVEVRYLDRDCGLTGMLPTRIEMASEARGWRATVRILKQEENVELDDALFALPAAGEDDS